MKDWDDELHKALAHRIRRSIIECLQERNNLSFQELLKYVGITNHGKYRFSIRERLRSLEYFLNNKVVQSRTAINAELIQLPLLPIIFFVTSLFMLALFRKTTPERDGINAMNRDPVSVKIS